MRSFSSTSRSRRGGAGSDRAEAIREACVARFRPILITTLAALFGASPLALGAGEGAETRRPLGIAIVGGLLVSQILTLYTTPVVFLFEGSGVDLCAARAVLVTVAARQWTLSSGRQMRQRERES